VGQIIVSGSFDDLRLHHIRFLEEAAKLGQVHVLLWSDETTTALTGQSPKFPWEERLYILQALRYVDQISTARGSTKSEFLVQVDELQPQTLVVSEFSNSELTKAYCESRDVSCKIILYADLPSFPFPQDPNHLRPSKRKKAIVTGCFDWLHSGHVRFFEEVSQLGALYVLVGHDANVRLLKGKGHPQFSQDERRYMVQAIRHVERALITSGRGWMDAEPEIDLLEPEMYVVNEDGDRPEKRAFCDERGIEYIVLKRLPKEGLQRRESTTLRGF